MSDVTVKATLEMTDKPRILVKWDYTPNFRDVIDSLKAHTRGARFRKADKVWALPVTVDNCHGLRQAFGSDLTIKRPLADWYIANKEEGLAQTASSAAADAELLRLPTVAPALAATLRPDQRAGVAWIATSYRGAGLVADKPGLGKTLETIGGVLEAGRTGNILVVCPKISVRNVWNREIKRWTDEPVYMCRGTRAQREAAIVAFDEDPAERKWLIIVAEMLRVQRKENDTQVKANAKRRGRIEGFEYPYLFNNGWDTIIADESQRLLGSLTVAKSNLMGEGLVKLPQPPDSRRYALSGTPFGRGGRIHGMFGTLHWLWPDEYTSFWRWADDHFEVEEAVIGKGGKTAKKIIGLKDNKPPEKFVMELGPRILRRTKEEVLKDLPPKQYIEVLCEMESGQKNQYLQLGDDAEIMLPTGGSLRSSKRSLIMNGVLAEITRAKQIANGALWFDVNQDRVRFNPDHSCKLDALMQKLEDRGLTDGGTSDTKIIISSRFNAFINDALLPRLDKHKVEYHLLTGGTTEAERDRQMDAFQGEGGPKVFVLNSKAGGVSINLDAADEVHCLDELDNPEDNEQLEDRAHRASRNHQVSIYYYRTAGTYDMNVAESVENKRQAQYEVLDGRRGIQDVRNWIKYQEES